MGYNETIKKITSMAEDGDGIMWLGTNDGVRSAEIINGKIELKNGREQKTGISKSEVMAVYVNRHNQLYISYADKIVQTDGLREGIYDIKFLQKDMIGGHNTCIIDDKSGNTWMGNNTGIMTIQNKTKTSYTYTFAERFYNVCQLNDGQLMWSNSAGLMYFNPNALKKRSKANQLYISDIGINYKKIDIDNSHANYEAQDMRIATLKNSSIGKVCSKLSRTVKTVVSFVSKHVILSLLALLAILL